MSKNASKIKKKKIFKQDKEITNERIKDNFGPIVEILERLITTENL